MIWPKSLSNFWTFLDVSLDGDSVIELSPELAFQTCACFGSFRSFRRWPGRCNSQV